MSLVNKGSNLVIALLVVGVLVAISGILVQSLRDSQTAASKAYDIADAGLNGTVKLGSQLPTIGLILGVALFVLVAVLIIKAIMGVAKGEKKGGRRQQIMVIRR